MLAKKKDTDDLTSICQTFVWALWLTGAGTFFSLDVRIEANLGLWRVESSLNYESGLWWVEVRKKGTCAHGVGPRFVANCSNGTTELCLSCVEAQKWHSVREGAYPFCHGVHFCGDKQGIFWTFSTLQALKTTKFFRALTFAFLLDFLLIYVS